MWLNVNLIVLIFAFGLIQADPEEDIPHNE